MIVEAKNTTKLFLMRLNNIYLQFHLTYYPKNTKKIKYFE